MFCCSTVMSGSHNSRQADSVPGWEAPQCVVSSEAPALAVSQSPLFLASFWKLGPLATVTGLQSLIVLGAFLVPLLAGAELLAATAYIWMRAQLLPQPHSVFHLYSTEPFILLLSPCMHF